MTPAAITPEVRARFEELRGEQAEARVFLDVALAAREEARRRAWTGAVRDVKRGGEQDLPVLAGAVLPVRSSAPRRWRKTLQRIGPPDIAELRSVDLHGLLTAALNQDVGASRSYAKGCGLVPERVHAYADMLAMPLLAAAGFVLRGSVAARWAEGCCPVCGAWPALGEVRGIERRKHLRCGRCATGWPFPHRRCAYCRNDDAQSLRSLVEPGDEERRRVETCQRCHGYLKLVSTISPWPADAVLLEDLAHVDLDLVATERGYARPAQPALALGVRVVSGR